MSNSASTEQISKFLSSLRHTGPVGFEGLVAVLLEAITGQRFRLSRSGQQSGQDARSESGYGNRIKVEAKHYKKDTLDERELTAEIVQAISLGAGVDLWILAASCRVSEQLETDLEKIAQQHNIEVLFLDLGTDGLPRIAVLMAAFPERVSHWIQQNNIQCDADGLNVALRQLAAEPTFSAAVAQMREKLAGTLLGYEDARRRSRKLLLGTLSDQGNTMSMFNQRVALRSKDLQLIHRVAVSDALLAWWSRSLDECKPAVVLGEEGTGKTWAVMDWLAHQIDGNSMPIVLPFSASAEPISSGETIEDLLPKLLAKWTGAGDSVFWTKRLERWLNVEGARSQPLLLIFADGLGERAALDWPSFFRTLEHERWRGLISVLATDRPGHWRPNCARAGLDTFQEIEISGYTDSELLNALDGKGIALSSIPHDLQELIRRPRYCQLVSEHFHEMQANADFTVERLILLDARHRTESKRGQLTENQFIEIIQNLALQYRESPIIHLSKIPNLWPVADPDRKIHQQILDGGLLIPKDGLGIRFTVERTRLVFGLGMLFADEIRALAEQGNDKVHIENEIASWFEPHPDMDLKVEICGAALFHSLADETYPTTGRREILRYWLGLRNWHDGAQAAFVNYVVRCPQDFIAMAEEFWLSTHDVGAAQDFLAEAFTKHRDNSRVQPLLVAAVAKWMGFVHPAGHPILRQDPERREQRRKEIEARVGFPLVGSVRVCGESLTVVQDDGVMRLGRLSLRIMSAGPRLPFIHALVPWAVASAVMGQVMEANIVEWVIYLSDEPLEEQLRLEANRLVQMKSALATKAAITLLWRIDSKAAKKLSEDSDDDQYKERQLWRAQIAQDPCVNLFPWSDENCLRCQERIDVHPLRIVDGLDGRVFNPDYDFPKSLIERMARLLKIDPAQFRAGSWATIEDHATRKILPVLALHAPAEVAKFIAAVVATLPTRDPENQYPLLLWLPDMSIFLGESEKGVIRSLLSQIRPRIAQENMGDGGERLELAEAFALLSIAPHLGAKDLFSSLLKRSDNALDMMRFEPWFDELAEDDIEFALGIVNAPPDDTVLKRTLWFLAGTRLTLSERDRERIVALTQSENKGIRWAALRFSCLCDDELLRHAIVNLGRSFNSERGDSDVAWGSRILIRHSSHLPFVAVALRLHPADAGYALVHRGLQPNEVTEYAEMLDSCYQSILAAVDPAISKLPSVFTNSESNPTGHDFPQFSAQEAPPTITFKDSSMTWGSRPPPPTNALEFDSKGYVDRLNRLSRERVSAIRTAWKTDAFQWFGLGFTRSALGRICRDLPDFGVRWTEPAFLEGPVGQKVILRLGSFLATLCPSLFEHDPPRGFKLWQVLGANRVSAVVFDAAFAAFEASDNDFTDTARSQVFENCHDDASLSRVAYLAELNGRQEWLESTVQRGIAESPLWRRARALTLASFTNVTTDQFERYVALANLDGTWLSDQIPILTENVRKNQFAQGWYKLFLEGNGFVAWGALQMLLSCGDHRFFTWCRSFERGKGDRHLRLIESMGRNLRDDLDRSSERKRTFFGIKVERGEIFPFVDV